MHARLLVAVVFVGVGLLTPHVALAQAPGGDVTFAKDIAPILQRSCQNCHRPQGVAPMSLVTYEEVRPWARAIKTRTGLGPRAGLMPPLSGSHFWPPSTVTNTPNSVPAKSRLPCT